MTSENTPDGRDPHRHEHAHDHPAAGTHVHGHDHEHVPETAADEELDARWVEIRHLHYSYPDGFEALRGVDLRVGRGERIALIGPNGAGKSTLLLHLNGTNRPSHGSVAIAGVTVNGTSIKRIRSEVGLVFQDPDDQLFSPTVFEDVAFGPLHMGLAADEVHLRVERALEAVGMSGFGQRLPHHLSIGQRKRVALATVLSMDPSVLVFDEPSSGLDPRGRRQLIELLRSLPETLIVASHDMRLVSEVMARVAIVDEGVIVTDGATAEVLADERLLEAHGLERP